MTDAPVRRSRHAHCPAIPHRPAILAVVLSALGLITLSGPNVFAASSRTIHARSTMLHSHAKKREANPFTTRAMKSYLATRTGNITAAVYDVATKKTFSYRPGIAEQTASIVKVDILATLLHESQLDHRSLSEDQQELATGMIEQSNNDDATELWDEVGGPGAIATFNAEVGLEKTHPNTHGYWGETTTTALDQIRLLKTVTLANHLLDASSRGYELDLMEHVIAYDYWGVPAGVPEGVTVAVKNGWVPIVAGNWQINSIGDVDGDDGGTHYLLAILTNHNATEDYGEATTEGISRLIWKELSSSPSPSRSKKKP